MHLYASLCDYAVCTRNRMCSSINFVFRTERHKTSSEESGNVWLSLQQMRDDRVPMGCNNSHESCSHLHRLDVSRVCWKECSTVSDQTINRGESSYLLLLNGRSVKTISQKKKKKIKKRYRGQKRRHLAFLANFELKTEKRI